MEASDFCKLVAFARYQCKFSYQLLDQIVLTNSLEDNLYVLRSIVFVTSFCWVGFENDELKPYKEEAALKGVDKMSCKATERAKQNIPTLFTAPGNLIRKPGINFQG